jgi:hypothetical protein
MPSLRLPSDLGILSCPQPLSGGAKHTSLSVRAALLDLSKISCRSYCISLSLMTSNKLANIKEMLHYANRVFNFGN